MGIPIRHDTKFQWISYHNMLFYSTLYDSPSDGIVHDAASAEGFRYIAVPAVKYNGFFHQALEIFGF